MHDFATRHFQREHGAGLACVNRRVFNDIHGKRRFTHTRTSCQNDQRTRLQTVRDFIKAFVPRRNPLKGIGIGLQLFEFLQHFAHDIPVVHPHQRRAFGLFGYIVNAFFGVCQRRFVVRALHGRFDDLSRRADQFSIHAVARNDLLIGLIICRGRRNLRQFGNIRDTARLFDTAFLFQLVRNGNEIDRFSVVIHPFHCAQNIFVTFLIKIVFRQSVHNIRRNFVIDQKAAKERHFRVAVIGHRVHFVCHNISSFRVGRFLFNAYLPRCFCILQ